MAWNSSRWRALPSRFQAPGVARWRLVADRSWILVHASNINFTLLIAINNPDTPAERASICIGPGATPPGVEFRLRAVVAMAPR